MLRRFINHIVTSIKGEMFELDAKIPLGYLFAFFWEKAWMCFGVW